MSDEDDNEKTQIFLRPAGEATPAPPTASAPAHEVVIKPARKAADKTRTAVDFDVTASGATGEVASARPRATGDAAAPQANSSRGIVIGVGVAVIAAVVAAVVLLR
jgi:hypothetical protein